MTEQSVGIVGVGRLGSDVAFTLAERDLCDLVLFDTDRDKAEYLASDLTDTSFGHVYNRRVSFVREARELASCGVILVAAGARREAGTPADELFGRNLAIIDEMAEAFVGSSNLFVVATEPVDLMTEALARALNLPASRVMGIGGVVDSYRVRHALGDALAVNPDYIRTHVIGPHDEEASIVWDCTSINGVPVAAVGSAETLAGVEKTFAADAEARLSQMSETYSRYTPSMACLELLRSLVKDDRRVLSVTIPWSGIMGISGVAMSIPAVIGRFGAERPIPPGLNKPALDKLKRSAGRLATALQGGAR